MTGNPVVLESYNDLAAACAVQQRFMQHWSPEKDAWRYSARCRQLCNVGGDCYDFIRLPDNRLAVAIADASGKGMAAALSISGLQSSLRTAVSFAGNDPGAVVEAVNRQVHASSLAGRYATLFFGIFDEVTRSLCYVNAGHNAPIIVSHNRSDTCLNAGGLPVGMFPDSKYSEGEVQLWPGDLLIAYTDGITEATNSAGDEFGVERLRQTAAHAARLDANEIVEKIFQAVDEFSNGHQSDDATLLVLRTS